MFSDGGVPTVMYVDPSKLNALPTSPGTYPGFPNHVPLFPLTISSVLPSAGHQLIMFAGGGSHVGDGDGDGVGVGVDCAEASPSFATKASLKPALLG